MAFKPKFFAYFAKVDQFAAIQTFVKVVETESFSEASRQLNMAVSSVTRQINALETLLNTQLFNRSTRRITLTFQGRKYYDKVNPLLQELNSANLSVAEKDEVPRGLLRVSLPVAFGRLHVAPLLGDFLAQYPEIQLDLIFNDRLANPVVEGLDLVIRIGNLERSGVNWMLRKLASNSRKVCASPTYLKLHGVPKHPQNLSEHNCLCFSYAMGYDTWQFRYGSEICKVKVKGSLVANHSEVLRQACLDSMGIILMPTWLVGKDIQAGRLQTVLNEYTFYPQQDTDDGIYALYLPNRSHSLRVQVFVDFLIQRLSNLNIVQNQ